jgi:membrane-associated phospholipid phosphatase
MKAFIGAILMSLLAAPALAADYKTAADIASWGTVGTALALDANSCRSAADPRHCFIMMGIRAGVTEISVEVLKHLIKQPRPCAGEPGCEGYGMPSGHTAFAFSTLGGPGFGVSFTLSLGTGVGRVVADKHTPWQVLAGAALGMATSRIR